MVYVLLLVYLLFLAFYRNGTNNDVNLTPFHYIRKLLTYVYTHPVSWEYFIYVHSIMIANLFLFTPIPFLFDLQTKFWKRLLISISIPTVVEFIQFLFKIGTADIDDVILNASGFMLGFWLVSRRSAKTVVPRSE